MSGMTKQRTPDTMCSAQVPEANTKLKPLDTSSFTWKSAPMGLKVSLHLVVRRPQERAKRCVIRHTVAPVSVKKLPVTRPLGVAMERPMDGEAFLKKARPVVVLAELRASRHSTGGSWAYTLDVWPSSHSNTVLRLPGDVQLVGQVLSTPLNL